jgi:hypothetical protein
MSNPRPPEPSGGRRRATVIGVVIALLALLGVAYGVGRADGATTQLAPTAATALFTPA